MSVDIIARAEARIASLSTDAERLEHAALRLAQKAADCRMGVRDMQNFITMARELAEDEPSGDTGQLEPQAAMPAQTEPAGAEGVLAGQASVESPATNTETSAAMPGSGAGASDAAPASAGGDSAAPPATHSAEAPMDEVGTASSSEELTERSALTATDPLWSGSATREDAGPAAPGDHSLAKASEAEPVVAQSAQPEGDVSRPSVGGGTDASIRPEAATEKGEATPPAGGETQAPPAPKPTIADRIIELQADHPDWTARQFAEALGKSVESIRSAANDRGIAIMKAGVGGRPVAAAGGKSLRQRIADALEEHPNMTAREVADHLGVNPNHVATVASQAGLPVRKLTPEEKASALRSGGQRGGLATREAAPPPEPPPSTGYVSLPVIPPELRKAQPKASGKVLFYLRSDNGKYLHQSCQGLVPGPSYAWKGTEAQIFKVRDKFPEALGLTEEAVRG